MDLQIFETLVSESIRPPSMRVERLPQKFEAHGFDVNTTSPLRDRTPDGLYREVTIPTQFNGWLLPSLLPSKFSNNQPLLP